MTPEIPYSSNFDDQNYSFPPSLIKDLFIFTETVQKFDPSINGKDQDWQFHLKLGKSWQVLDIKLYKDTWYCNISPGVSRRAFENKESNFSFNLFRSDLTDSRQPIPLEVELALPEINTKLNEIYYEVFADALKYNSKLLKQLPPTHRWGAIPSSFVRDLLPEWMPFLEELTPIEINHSIEICEQPKPEIMSEMTAELYFDYCKIAYLANPKSFAESSYKFDPSLPGRELYKRYADGRDNGLTKINPRSAQAFNDWYKSKQRQGGHPWEIYRGGNSTHIDLGVLWEQTPSNKGWHICLEAFSSGRLVETCRIAMALNNANLPFQLVHAESYLQRLRKEDMVGIVPKGCDLRYGYQSFPKDFKVADCIHFEWLRDKLGRQIAPWKEISAVTTWLPIRPVKLR